MLSSLTIFLEHHPALLDAGVFPALMATVLDSREVPQVRHCDKQSLLLPCTDPWYSSQRQTSWGSR